MKQDLELFRASCTEIDQLIWTKCLDSSGKSEPIIDGIFNIEMYQKEPLRILWILKEPYDDDGGGWSFPEELRKDISSFK